MIREAREIMIGYLRRTWKNYLLIPSSQHTRKDGALRHNFECMMKHASNASQSRCIYAISSSFLSRCFKCNGCASSKKKHHSRSSSSPWRLCPTSGRSLKRMMLCMKNVIHAQSMPQLQEEEERQLSRRCYSTEILSRRQDL